MLNVEYLLSDLPQIGQTADPKFEDAARWLIRFCNWVQHAQDLDESLLSDTELINLHIDQFTKVIKSRPEWKLAFLRVLRVIAEDLNGASAWSRLGLSAHPSFLQDFSDRFLEKILPEAPLHEDLGSILKLAFESPSRVELFRRVDPEIWSAFLDLCADPTLLEELRQQLKESARALALMIMHASLSWRGETLGRSRPLDEWPETKLHTFITNRYTKGSQSEATVSVDPFIFYQLLAQCRTEIAIASQDFDEFGISVDQVYQLRQRGRWLDRLELLVKVLDKDQKDSFEIRDLLIQLVRDLHANYSFRAFMAENFSLLSSRIVERNSHIGEHYITYSWAEFRQMLMSASGGGAMTSITVFMKFVISKMHLTGFLQGMFDGTNYSLSFLTMYFAGFTLATKQPSSTAPYLAAQLKLSVTEARRAMIALLRTQIIAIIGNVMFVIPICLGVSLLSTSMGYNLVSLDKAMDVVRSTDLFGASTLYASFTGVLLFSSSLIAGWFENFVILHRLPERLENNETQRKFLGVHRHRVAHVLRTYSSPIASNVSLGFLLGLAPQFLQFFGLPLEVRHITLATGSLVAVLPTAMSQTDVSGWQLASSAVGILWIGFLNLSVSFSLAFILAASSSKVKIGTFLGLVRWCLGLILIKPWLLFVPEDQAPARPANH